MSDECWLFSCRTIIIQIPAAQPYNGSREGNAQITKPFCLSFIKVKIIPWPLTSVSACGLFTLSTANLLVRRPLSAKQTYSFMEAFLICLIPVPALLNIFTISRMEIYSAWLKHAGSPYKQANNLESTASGDQLTSGIKVSGWDYRLQQLMP